MRTKTTGGRKQMTTETKIKRTLTRLQKLVRQYYDENPDTTDSMVDNKYEISYYGSATIGIAYNKYTDKWQAIANVTIRRKCGNYLEIASPIDHKPVK